MGKVDPIDWDGKQKIDDMYLNFVNESTVEPDVTEIAPEELLEHVPQWRGLDARGYPRYDAHAAILRQSLAASEAQEVSDEREED